MTAPPDPGLVRWLYHFTDLRSARLKATLPLRGVSLSEVLGEPADGTADLPLRSPEAEAIDPYEVTAVRRTGLWAERRVLDSRSHRIVSSTLPWAGIVMRRARSVAGSSVKLTAVTWHSYLGRRRTPDLALTGDVFTIARRLVAAAVQQPGGAYPAVSPHHTDLSITGGPLAGVEATVRYRAVDERSVLDDLNDLAAAHGFDWHLVPYMTGPSDLSGLRVRLELGLPRLGRLAPPDLRWSTRPAELRDRWGQLVDATITEDGSAVDNEVTVLGEGSGPTQVRATVTADDAGVPELAAGMPLYQGTAGSSSSTAVRTVGQAEALGRATVRANLAGEVRLSGIKVRGDLAPDLTTYAVGDDITVDLGETLSRRQLTVVGQLIGRTITPPERGRTEGVTMDLQGTA